MNNPDVADRPGKYSPPPGGWGGAHLPLYAPPGAEPLEHQAAGAFRPYCRSHPPVHRSGLLVLPSHFVPMYHVPTENRYPTIAGKFKGGTEGGFLQGPLGPTVVRPTLHLLELLPERPCPFKLAVSALPSSSERTDPPGPLMQLLRRPRKFDAWSTRRRNAPRLEDCTTKATSSSSPPNACPLSRNYWRDRMLTLRRPEAVRSSAMSTALRKRAEWRPLLR